MAREVFCEDWVIIYYKRMACDEFSMSWHKCMLSWYLLHYSDVKMRVIKSQITGISIVCSTICSGADQRKHQSSASPLVAGVQFSNAENVSNWWRHHVIMFLIWYSITITSYFFLFAHIMHLYPKRYFICWQNTTSRIRKFYAKRHTSFSPAFPVHHLPHHVQRPITIWNGLR